MRRILYSVAHGNRVVRTQRPAVPAWRRKIAAARGAQVSGLDAAEALLEIARRRAPQGDFRQGDLEELPFDDDSFDMVTGFNAFQYAGSPAVALAEARRVARPGGTVVIMTWSNPDGMEAASLVAAVRPLMPPPPPGAPGHIRGGCRG